MQCNTVETKKRSVHFSNFSVGKEGRMSDPFSTRDGHYVGHDGFVVPRDFAEFTTRFPDYVHRWVSKHAGTSASREDIEDWTQDLLVHLSRLPETSKHRDAGKTDIVATFNPLRHYGANEARFRNYINLCLANKFRTMYSKRMKDVLGRPGTFSLDGEKSGEKLGSVDEFCHKHSAHFRVAEKASQKQSHDSAFLQQFLNFVARKDAKALATIQAMMATGTWGQAAYWLGIPELEFDRRRTPVKRLARCFVTGEPIPKQRRPYKKRKRTSGCQLMA
jgi:hypothetical protein